MNDESTAALALLSRMRFACGDNGLRMQDELEEYLRELKRDAERYRWLRARWGRISEVYEGNSENMIEIGDETDGWEVAPDSLDRCIDAAMNGANTRINPRREAASG